MDKETWDDILTNGAYLSELDWIATDKTGQIGIFSAIMDAPIPKQIRHSFELFKELQELIAKLPENSTTNQVITNSGDFSCWLKYSRKGLFAFDFQDVHRIDKLNQYDLIATPSPPLNIKDLKLKKELIIIIPQFDCNFGLGNLKND